MMGKLKWKRIAAMLLVMIMMSTVFEMSVWAEELYIPEDIMIENIIEDGELPSIQIPELNVSTEIQTECFDEVLQETDIQENTEDRIELENQIEHNTENDEQELDKETEENFDIQLEIESIESVDSSEFLSPIVMITGKIPDTSGDVVNSGTCGNNLIWSIADTEDGEQVLTVTGTGGMFDYGFDVAPWHDSQLTNPIEYVIIEDGVTSIGDYAFADCGSLVAIEIGHRVAVIGDGAFAGSLNFGFMFIPNSALITIGSYAFEGCRFNSVKLPLGLRYIGDGAFAECMFLETIMIPDSVTSIGENAFLGCNDLLITGFSDSYAEQYAQEYGISFKSDGCYEYPYDMHSVYSEQDWILWLNNAAHMLNFLSRPDNFLHVSYISKNDADWIGRFEYYYTNFIDFEDGWSELLAEKVSQEEAEQILYALLYENDKEIKELALAKAENSLVQMISYMLSQYLTARAIDPDVVSKMSELITEDSFKECLSTGGFDSAMELLLNAVDKESSEYLSDIIEDFKTSNALEKGLEKLGVGLQILDLSKVAFDSYCDYLVIKESNNLYRDMLTYIENYGKKEVICNAAKNLRMRAEATEAEVLATIAAEIAIEGTVSIAVDKAFDSIWFLKAAKGAMEAGNVISNVFFHTQDISKLKSSMRISAYIGQSIAG